MLVEVLLSTQPHHLSTLLHQPAQSSDGAVQRSSGLFKSEEQLLAPGASIDPQDSLSLAGLEEWLLVTNVPGKQKRLADCLTKPFRTLLAAAAQWYTNDAITFRPDLDRIRFPVARLPQLAQALADGVVDCFVLEAYPAPEWFDTRPDVRDLSRLEFALACTTGEIRTLSANDRFETVVIDDDDLETLRMGRSSSANDIGANCDDIDWDECSAAFRQLHSTLPIESSACTLAGTARIVFTAIESMELSEALPPVPRQFRHFVAHGSFIHFMLMSPFDTITPLEWLAVQNLCTTLGSYSCAGRELTTGIMRSAVVHGSTGPAGPMLYAATPEMAAFHFRAAL